MACCALVALAAFLIHRSRKSKSDKGTGNKQRSEVNPSGSKVIGSPSSLLDETNNGDKGDRTTPKKVNWPARRPKQPGDENSFDFADWPEPGDHQSDDDLLPHDGRGAASASQPSSVSASGALIRANYEDGESSSSPPRHHFKRTSQYGAHTEAGSASTPRRSPRFRQGVQRSPRRGTRPLAGQAFEDSPAAYDDMLHDENPPGAAFFPSDQHYDDTDDGAFEDSLDTGRQYQSDSMQGSPRQRSPPRGPYRQRELLVPPYYHVPSVEEQIVQSPRQRVSARLSPAARMRGSRVTHSGGRNRSPRARLHQVYQHPAQRYADDAFGEYSEGDASIYEDERAASLHQDDEHDMHDDEYEPLVRVPEPEDTRRPRNRAADMQPMSKQRQRELDDRAASMRSSSPMGRSVVSTHRSVVSGGANRASRAASVASERDFDAESQEPMPVRRPRSSSVASPRSRVNKTQPVNVFIQTGPSGASTVSGGSSRRMQRMQALVFPSLRKKFRRRAQKPVIVQVMAPARSVSDGQQPRYHEDIKGQQRYQDSSAPVRGAATTTYSDSGTAASERDRSPIRSRAHASTTGSWEDNPALRPLHRGWPVEAAFSNSDFAVDIAAAADAPTTVAGAPEKIVKLQDMLSTVSASNLHLMHSLLLKEEQARLVRTL